MTRWICKMFYGDKLYTGHYWTDELSLARARKRVAELQRFHPPMRFELTDARTGAIINT
jgi:hypothetical protein